ncbi:MAG: hypothetical protein M0Z56_13070 [Desulfobacteraceae bacterium]|nr:hypothetical protein [Desulfobacteraceae bacterium]
MTIQRVIKEMMLCFILMAVFNGFALAGPDERPQTRVYLGVSVYDFKWAEYQTTGDRILKEKGPLYGFDVEVASAPRRFGWQGGGNVFFGQTDYDGQTWSDSPVKTDVLYAGGGMYGDGVICFRPLPGLALTSFAGLGAQGWLRDLADTRTKAGIPVQGAEEWWGCVYGRLGVGGNLIFCGDWEAFTSGGVKLPVYARNEADFHFSGSDWAGLEPEMAVSGFGEAGLRWRRFGVKFSWDALRFDRSASVSAGSYNLYQPESKADVFKVGLFWAFGK